MRRFRSRYDVARSLRADLQNVVADDELVQRLAATAADSRGTTGPAPGRRRAAALAVAACSLTVAGGFGAAYAAGVVDAPWSPRPGPTSPPGSPSDHRSGSPTPEPGSTGPTDAPEPDDSPTAPGDGSSGDGPRGGGTPRDDGPKHGGPRNHGPDDAVPTPDAPGEQPEDVPPDEPGEVPGEVPGDDSAVDDDVLPAVPEVPGVPELPELPELPEVPELPTDPPVVDGPPSDGPSGGEDTFTDATPPDVVFVPGPTQPPG